MRELWTRRRIHNESLFAGLLLHLSGQIFGAIEQIKLMQQTQVSDGGAGGGAAAPQSSLGVSPAPRAAPKLEPKRRLASSVAIEHVVIFHDSENAYVGKRSYRESARGHRWVASSRLERGMKQPVSGLSSAVAGFVRFLLTCASLMTSSDSKVHR